MQRCAYQAQRVKSRSRDRGLARLDLRLQAHWERAEGNTPHSHAVETLQSRKGSDHLDDVTEVPECRIVDDEGSDCGECGEIEREAGI